MVQHGDGDVSGGHVTAPNSRPVAGEPSPRLPRCGTRARDSVASGWAAWVRRRPLRRELARALGPGRRRSFGRSPAAPGRWLPSPRLVVVGEYRQTVTPVEDQLAQRLAE